ncbi:MAG: signal peptide peptidase SppA [Saprospiraceae bacterium]|nr:signal peptide peptidase SppA [Saprospiraceae bacterium]
MRKFLRIVFGSCLGVLLALLVVGLVASFFAGSIMGSGKKAPDVTSNSVLKLELNQVIPEKTGNTMNPPMLLSEEMQLGLYDIVSAVQRAKEDRNIKGIYLDLGFGSFGNAKAESLREAILDFKESGKFVVAYANRYGYGQGSYYLASAADEVWLHPLAAVDFRGFGTQITFYKDMLDKIGIEMQPFYAGKFKSATEPFRRTDMSDENREQVRIYVSELWEDFIADISESRAIPVSNLRTIAENVEGRMADGALASKLVDELLYEDEVFDRVRERLDLDKKEKIKFISLQNYNSANGADINLGAPSKIAILYAEGQIMAGEETYGTITDDHYVGMLRKIRKDDKVDAVVLRVNSGGGDAIVSDMIWREIELLKEKGVKVVASFADVAASGGYYIACGADEILAEPNCITGSIGVFGIVPNVQKLFNNKLGLHVDTMKTNAYATGIVNPMYPIGRQQSAMIQESINHTYEVFLERVSQGRNMTRDAVHEVAQGRIWTGRMAAENGLVDQLGSLQDAVTRAAELADISDYRITEYPRIKDPYTKLIEDLTGQKMPMAWQEKMFEKQFPETAAMLKELEGVMQSKGPQARIPFYFEGL